HGIVRAYPMRFVAIGSRKELKGRASEPAAALALILLGIVLLARARAHWPLYLLAAFLLGCGAGLLTRRWVRSRRGGGPRHRGVRVDADGVVFERGPLAPLAERVILFGRPFGLTLLADRARDRLVLAVTTGERALYVGARLLPEEKRMQRALL